MLNRLLRRLQGRPMPLHDRAAGGAVALMDSEPDAADAAAAERPAGVQAGGDVVSSPELDVRGLCWLLGIPRDVPDEGAAAQALAYLEPLARRLDPRRLPRLPTLVPQLMAALRRDDTGAQGLATLLARDPTLAGDVMRVANSAFYRRATPASGLVQAVAVLGADGLRHVVLTSVMRPILRPDSRSATAGRLWELAEARTWFCARLAVGRHDVAEAQLAAVVASTGTGALLGMAPAVLLAPAASSAAFVDGVRSLASDITLRAAAHWHLPEPVLRGLQAPDGDDALAAVLRTGERLALGHLMARDRALASTETVCGGAGMVGDPDTQAALLAAFAIESGEAPADAA